MSARALPLLLGLSLLAPACADDMAPAKCVGFRDAYCAKQDEHCAFISFELCQEIFDEVVECDDAIDIEDEYATCLEEIADIDSCPANIPADCRGVIVFPEEDDDDDDDAGPADSGLPDWLVPEGGGPPMGFDAGAGGPPMGFDAGMGGPPMGGDGGMPPG
jgi:hypothetical protein